MLLMIDNYDSFTYNLVQYFGELGERVTVYRNDQLTLNDVDALAPSHVVISPGPCTPNEAGISVDLVREYGARIPILGVCLGHQSIAQAYGGNIVRAPTLMHGKTSMISHEGESLFGEIPTPFQATRYHSLVVERDSLPAHFEVTAETEDRLIMGMNHRELPIHGLQFHPESIETQYGHDMLKNFLDAAWAANNQIEWPAAAA